MQKKDIHILESLTAKYGKTQLLNEMANNYSKEELEDIIADLMSEYSAEDLIDMINTIGNKMEVGFTKVEYNKIKKALADYGFEVEHSPRAKQIKIWTNDPTHGFYTWRDKEKKGTYYLLTHRPNGYSIRRVSGNNSSPLNYKNGNYHFETFDEMYDYFMNFFTKKYKKASTEKSESDNNRSSDLKTRRDHAYTYVELNSEADFKRWYAKYNNYLKAGIYHNQEVSPKSYPCEVAYYTSNIYRAGRTEQVVYYKFEY